MPPNPSDYLHSHAVQPPLPPKPNHKFLAIILKALVMTFVTSLFFLFLGVAAMLLLLFLSAGAVHRASRLRTRRHHRRRRPAHSRAALRRLAQFRFSAADADGAAEGDCVVCLDAFRDGQWCRKLAACGHVFHRRCLDTWLVKTPACPICRTRVRLDAGDGFSSAEDWEDEAKWWWGFDRNNGFEGLVGM